MSRIGHRGSLLAAAAAATAAGGYWAGFGAHSQQFGAFPYRGETELPLVALTFDDGPNEPYTSRLLDILGERSAPATFFQVGRCAERFPSATRRVVDEGHVLGNHSYHHSFTSYLRTPRQTQEIARAQIALNSIAGVTPALYRPPWLCHWPWVLSSVSTAGLHVVSGDFAHPLEIFQPPAVWMTRRAEGLAAPGAILIFHDGYESYGGRRDQSIAAIGPLIDSLRQRGFGFTTVDQLLGVPAYQS
ncbi:MAG TPA: polysaccharide deacetylase family protein [Microlunatus sp.]|nr:polysaccharide deacetylase family protein [Microlunatus sp.]